MNDKGNTQNAGHEAAGSRGEAAHAQHQVRTPAAQDAGRLGHGHRQLPRGGHQGEPALAPQALDADPLDLKAMLGHQPRLHLLAGPDPEDLLSLVPQQLGNRQGREDMTAGPAGHDG